MTTILRADQSGSRLRRSNDRPSNGPRRRVPLPRNPDIQSLETDNRYACHAVVSDAAKEFQGASWIDFAMVNERSTAVSHSLMFALSLIHRTITKSSGISVGAVAYTTGKQHCTAWIKTGCSSASK
jgi:hypothetical protein